MPIRTTLFAVAAALALAAPVAAFAHDGRWYGHERYGESHGYDHAGYYGNSRAWRDRADGHRGRFERQSWAGWGARPRYGARQAWRGEVWEHRDRGGYGEGEGR
ncbi:MAG: hypothetical protein KGO51_14755 [Alphaproteobacteria bacterium]|nr:hypothetical protein [Alphaproteobacteria bacterium]